MNPRARRPIAPALAVLAALVPLLVAACASGGSGAPGASSSPTPAPDAVRVVATTTVLADLVRQVGGTAVDATSLVPAGGEVHTFDPTPSDVQRLVEADLVVMNGLGLDKWLESLVADSGTTAPVVRLGEDLAGVEYIAAGDDHGADDGHGSINPHLWLDVSNARRYVERIGDALAAADAERADAFRSGAAAYDQGLAALDEEVRATLGAIPAERRRVVSSHEAFPYFAAAYGLEVVGTVVAAPGQEPSAGAVADLVRTIRETGATAILSEVQLRDDLAQTIAAETGAAIVSDLYTDSLGDPPVDTFEGLVRWDTARIAEALEG